MIQRIRCYFGKHLPRVSEFVELGWWYQAGHRIDGDSVLVWAEIWIQGAYQRRCPCCHDTRRRSADAVSEEITLRVPRVEWEKKTLPYAYFGEDGPKHLKVSELGAQFERVPYSIRKEQVNENPEAL